MDVYLSFNDWTITHIQRFQSLLPLGEMCTVPSAVAGIPIPDWSFVEYPNINARREGIRNTSWTALWSALQEQYFGAPPEATRDPVVRWRGRKTQPVFWKDAPLEIRIRRSIAGAHLSEPNATAALAVLGISNDVKIEREWMGWKDMCRALYQLHVDGYTNAYSLKYRLACGATMLRIEGGNWVGRTTEVPTEWYEAVTPLEPGVHYLPVFANFSNLVDQVVRTSRQDAGRIAQHAASYAKHHLSPDAVHCFKSTFITMYAKFYERYSRFCPPVEPVGAQAWCTRPRLDRPGVRAAFYRCDAKPSTGPPNSTGARATGNGRNGTVTRGRRPRESTGPVALPKHSGVGRAAKRGEGQRE
eukprot:1763593-Prymnesium_polylepis.2